MSQNLLYINYAEAQNRTASSDLFVVRLLTKIHQSMLENANVKLKPSHTFDMRYYYDALIRSIAGHYEYDVQDANSLDYKISATNLPTLTDSGWKNMHFVENGMAQRFVGLVKRESKEGGTPFDLSFACGIAAAALDEQAVQFIQEGIGKEFCSPAEDFDDWTGGFFGADKS